MSNVKKVIFDDANYIYHSFYNLNKNNLITSAVSPGDRKSQCFGKILNRIDIKNYESVFKDINENSQYMILFSDGSLMCYTYFFNINEELSGFSLSFLPSPTSDVLNDTSYPFHCQCYMRFDYEPDSFKEFVHPQIHLHTTLGRKNIRIPVNDIIYPSEFLLFIMHNIYNEQSTPLEKHLSSMNISKQRGYLTPLESKYFYFSV